VAAAGAGVDRWLPGRGGRSHFRRDRIHRAHAGPGPVPRGADFLIGGSHAGRRDALRRARLTVHILLTERIIVPEHISAGQRARILVGAFVPVADRIRIPEVIPVRLADPDPDANHVVAVPEPDPVGVPDPHPDPFRVVPVPARVHADERAFVRIGLRFYVAGADAGWRGLCPVNRRHP
jgi:hypothetical protein